MSLLDYARDEFSQNGDDGIIERIFSVISERPGLCCEFGAWDGIHFSNTRALVLRGWRSVMIEADESKFSELQRNYAAENRVICIHSQVDDDVVRLEKLLDTAGVSEPLDFLSIDIDGLDYYIFRSLTTRPRCIAVEVNAGHAPETTDLVPREVAAHNVGQPLSAFVQVASEHGYRLIGYSGNAYFLNEDAGGESELPTVEPVEAYREFLARSSPDARHWLFRVNLGLAPPFHRFDTPYLSRRSLRIPVGAAIGGAVRGGMERIVARRRR